jgi:N-acyl-D-amino-acid deacylase
MKTLIKNCNLVDGTGTPSRMSDVLLDGDTITNVGTNISTSSDIIIDAEGFTLSPGFIDPHTHSDISIIGAPDATGKISQGVTTDIAGNCGLSAFPVTEMNRGHLQSLYSKYGVEINWSSITEYIQRINDTRPSINITSLCGHNTLRASLAGYENRELSNSEINSLRATLSYCLSNGAAGFSTGLIYVPGKFASTAELSALISELTPFTLPYTTHLRSEGKELIESVKEAICIAKKNRLSKLHLSHLKVAREANWHKIDELAELIEPEKSDSLSITADRYPYTESLTQLSIILPAPFDDMPDAEIELMLKDISIFEKLLSQLHNYPQEKWSNIRLANTSCSQYTSFLGETIYDISTKLNLEPEIVCLEMLRENSTGTMASFKGTSPDNMNKIISKSYTCCGSDESARPVNYDFGRSHPRGFGSFPRYINMLSKTIGLEQAVGRVTSLPAHIFNLKNRGIIATGYIGDLVLFDPDALKDCATFQSPHELSDGIEKVWVNGTLSYSNKEVVNHAGKYIVPGIIK